MTLSEFKAWFEGFTETMDNTPNEKQWKRIQARVKEITGDRVTERVYLDRYWPINVQPYWARGVASCQSASSSAMGVVASNTSLYSVDAQPELSRDFDSHTAMYVLGKADADLVDAFKRIPVAS